MDQVEVDVEEVRLALGRAGRRARPRPSRPGSCPCLSSSRPRWTSSRPTLQLASHDLRRQYCHMDTTSGVGRARQGRPRAHRARVRAGDPGRPGRRHRPRAADRPPPRGRARAPPSGRPRPPGTLRARARGWPSSRSPPARTACSPRPARCSRGCATSPASRRSCGGARATTASASRPPSARPGCATPSRSARS